MRSIGFIPAARNLSRTCPRPGCGVGISAIAGVAPYSVTVIARKSASFQLLLGYIAVGSHGGVTRSSRARPVLVRT